MRLDLVECSHALLVLVECTIFVASHICDCACSFMILVDFPA